MQTARIIAAIGASGSGKSLWAKREFLTPKPDRLMIFDYKREHVGSSVVTTIEALIAVVRRTSFDVVFQPSYGGRECVRQFDLFCAIALEAGNCTVLVEELGIVTKPQFAPENWKRLCITGRSYKTTAGLASTMVVIATAQRPAMIDKDFLANCTLIHCGRVQFAPCAKVMIQMLGGEVTAEQLLQLADLEYVERDVLKRVNERGKIVI